MLLLGHAIMILVVSDLEIRSASPESHDDSRFGGPASQDAEPLSRAIAQE